MKGVLAIFNILLQVKKKKNNDWSWEDEMDMYDTSHRDQVLINYDSTEYVC